MGTSRGTKRKVRRASPHQPGIDRHKLEHYRMRVAMLTRSELAAKAGLSHSTISHLEKGLRQASVVTLRKLCTALNCEPSDLLADEDTAA